MGSRKRDLELLAASLEEQGARVRTLGGGQGWFVQLPNGKATTIHTSVSDHRGWKNNRAEVERAGLVWPAGLKL